MGERTPEGFTDFADARVFVGRNPEPRGDALRIITTDGYVATFLLSVNGALAVMFSDVDTDVVDGECAYDHGFILTPDISELVAHFISTPITSGLALGAGEAEIDGRFVELKRGGDDGPA